MLKKNRASLIPKSVLDAVYERRQKAKDAAAAIASAQSSISSQSATDPRTEILGSEGSKPNNAGEELPLRSRMTIIDSDESIEYADPEHLCTDCLPVYGDEIIGTIPVDNSIEATPKVHRVCCSIAQRAINRELAESQKSTADFSSNEPVNQQQVDSVNLQQGVSGRFQDPDIIVKPVKLQWSAYPGASGEKEHFFPCEIVVHCQDRKLLLADCSETVSELSEIIKTGSLTTNEHATLVFLVKIRCLDDLQKVMDSLRRIPSVMAVERRFGSELLLPPH